MFRLNGNIYEMTGPITVSELLTHIEEIQHLKTIARMPFIVNINNKIIAKKEYDTYLIQDGDSVNVLPMISGG